MNQSNWAQRLPATQTGTTYTASEGGRGQFEVIHIDSEEEFDFRDDWTQLAACSSFHILPIEFRIYFILLFYSEVIMERQITKVLLSLTLHLIWIKRILLTQQASYACPTSVKEKKLNLE